MLIMACPWPELQPCCNCQPATSLLFRYHYPHNSTSDGLVNAQGFFYSPLNAPAVAWGLALTLPNYTVGPTSILAYNVVNVNLQNAWNSTANTVAIPVSGTYFIDKTFYLCGSGTCGDGTTG
jgi:hypothetical protein